MMKTSKPCQQCGREFWVKSSRKDIVHCTRECRSMSGKLQKRCKVCGSKFWTVVSRTKYRKVEYCSRECYDSKHKKKVTIICEYCGKEFEVSPSRKNTRYCSKECYWLAPISDEARKHMSESHLGHKLTKSQREQLSLHAKQYWSDPENIKKRSRLQKDRMQDSMLRKQVAEKLRGTSRPIEVIEKIKKTKKLRPYKHSDEIKGKLRELRMKQKIPARGTAIELIVEEQLKKNGIEYTDNYPFAKRFLADFYLNDCNLILECDGDYWHSKPGAKEKDMKRDKIARNLGYKVLRLQESVIKKQDFDVINHLKDFIDT